MKKLLLVSLALASAFVITQSALAGSESLKNDKALKEHSDRLAVISTLAATTEPQSLFLLGTGFLGFASVLFLKAGKPSTRP